MTKPEKADRRPPKPPKDAPEGITYDPQGGGYYWGGQSFGTYDEALAAAESEATTDGVFKKGE